MNGFTLQADGYKKYLEKHPDADEALKADLTKQIKVCELLAELDESEQDILFNTGIFNEICNGYFKAAMKNCELDSDTIDSVLGEFRYILDTMTASDARKVN